MIQLKIQYPFIDRKGNANSNLIKHYAEDENGIQYYILQKETGIKYSTAIDVYPCRYTYRVTDEVVEEIPKSEKIKEN